MWHSNVYEAILNLVVYIYLFDDMPGVQCCVVCWIGCWNDTKCKMNETCLTLTRIDQHICWCSSALIDKETKQLTCKGILYIESKHKKNVGRCPIWPSNHFFFHSVLALVWLGLSRTSSSHHVMSRIVSPVHEVQKSFLLSPWWDRINTRVKSGNRNLDSSNHITSQSTHTNTHTHNVS